PGGNSGSQASTLVIRAMAVGEVRLRDWWHVMRRELLSGLALGAILGTIGFLRITIWSAFSTIYGPHWPLIALTIGLALVGIVLWGSLAGSMLPFMLRRAGLDPATSSAPFVATLVDVTGLIIYFSVAMLILRGTLLAPPSADVVRLDGQKGSEASQNLMNLSNVWEVKEIAWQKPTDRITIAVDASDDFADE